MTFAELQEIKADMPLPLDMEQKLAKTLVNKRSARKLKENAIAMLVRYSMREAFLYAGRCGKGQLTAEQLTSLSYLGLCKAAKNFRPGQLRFFSYAKIYVRSEVFRHFRTEGSVVRNVPADKIHSVHRDESKQRCSTEIEPKACSNEHHHGAGAVGFGFDEINSAEIWSIMLPKLKEILSPKEYFVVTGHYVDDLNFREIGDQLGDSRSWAQILHARAMRKIKAKANWLRTELDQ